MESKRVDVIVAGGGIAGLTAAVYLARGGKRVLLLEKNAETGGLVNSYERDGFVFDAGVRAILDAGVVGTMLRDLGIPLEFVKSRVSLGIGDKILDIDGLPAIDAYRDMLKDLYPASGEEIDRFIESMRRIMKLLDVLYGIENPLFKNVKKDRAYVFGTLLPWLPRYLKAVGRINRLSRPCEDYLRDMIRDPSLVDMISQHFFKATPTFFALSYFTLYLSYLYPKGGIGSLSRALDKKIRAFGGEILTGTRVAAVDPGRKIVTDDRNNRYEYSDLVWAADLKTLYAVTDVSGLNGGVQADIARTRALIDQARPGESVFSLNLEADLPSSYFSGISHGHFFYTPSAQGLGGLHRQGYADLMARWDSMAKEEVFDWLHRFLELNTFEISIPALRDPSLAPEGKTGLLVSILMEHELFERLRERGWEEEFRIETKNTILRILSGSIYPGLTEKVIKQFSFTPLSFRNRIGSSGGAIVGWSFESDIPVVHRMQQVSKSVETPIPGIYQAGQWAYNPAGLPTCIMTGKLAADRILK